MDTILIFFTLHSDLDGSIANVIVAALRNHDGLGTHKLAIQGGQPVFNQEFDDFPKVGVEFLNVSPWLCAPGNPST